MSILAAAPDPDPRFEAIFTAVCLTIGGAMMLRLFRPRRLDLPERLPAAHSAWPLVGLIGAGLLVWMLLVPGVYFAFKQAVLVAREGQPAKLDVNNLSAGDYAFISTVPPVIALAVLLTGDTLVRRTSGLDLGFAPRGVGRGVLLGLLASVCIVPLVFGFSNLSEWAYRLVGYHHPPEHDLLRAMSEARERPSVAGMLIVGAAVLAPLWEELLFRGHVQTVLRRMFGWVAREVYPPVDGVAVATAAPVATDAGIAEQPAVPPPIAPDVPWARVVPPVWSTWAAIILTSVLFSAVHASWTWPPIFILSLCLGYAYERTGSLWVPVTIHAVFNSIATVIYLAFNGGPT